MKPSKFSEDFWLAIAFMVFVVVLFVVIGVTMGDIGKPEKIIELEPLEAPAQEPIAVPSPITEPEKVPV